MPNRFSNQTYETSSAQEKRWMRPVAIELVAFNVKNTHKIYLLGCISVLAALYTHTNLFVWSAWFSFHVVLIAMRVKLMYRYLKLVNRNQIDAAALYYEKNTYIVGISGLLWGCTSYLFAYSEQYLLNVMYLMYVIAYAYSSVINFASHYPSMRLFILSYGTGLLLSFAAAGWLIPSLQTGLMYWLLLGGVVLFVTALFKQGLQLNRIYVNSLLFEYKNIQLIDSLTKEKESALSAIASKNRLIASTAHDMRQPVLALDLYANWMTEDANMAAELSPKIKIATRAVINQFDAMFDLAQLNEDQVKINLVEMDVLSILQELCDQQQIIAKARGLVVRRRLKSQIIKRDPILLKRILGNIISNSLKYSQRGGALVACRLKKQSLFIEVWDTGSGIDEQELELIFQEFYKSSTHAGTNDGFGLGLSIVKRLSQKLGHTIHVRSKLGAGTVMAVEIPLCPKTT